MVKDDSAVSALGKPQAKQKHAEDVQRQMSALRCVLGAGWRCSQWSCWMPARLAIPVSSSPVAPCRQVSLGCPPRHPPLLIIITIAICAFTHPHQPSQNTRAEASVPDALTQPSLELLGEQKQAGQVCKHVAESQSAQEPCSLCAVSAAMSIEIPMPHHHAPPSPTGLKSKLKCSKCSGHKIRQ